MHHSRKRFIKPDSVFFKKNSQGSYVLANADDENFSVLELEDSGIEIWEKINEKMTFDEILDWMKETYDGDPEEMKNDLNEFISLLINSGYLKVSS